MLPEFDCSLRIPPYHAEGKPGVVINPATCTCKHRRIFPGSKCQVKSRWHRVQWLIIGLGTSLSRWRCAVMSPVPFVSVRFSNGCLGLRIIVVLSVTHLSLTSSSNDDRRVAQFSMLLLLWELPRLVVQISVQIALHTQAHTPYCDSNFRCSKFDVQPGLLQHFSEPLFLFLVSLFCQRPP